MTPSNTCRYNLYKLYNSVLTCRQTIMKISARAPRTATKIAVKKGSDVIDGSSARRYTAIVTNQRARFRQSVKLSGQSRAWPAFKNTGSADITAK